MDNESYNPLNKAWKNTCKVLLGKEVGDLLEFSEYLKSYTDPIEKRTSIISGKEVTISSNRVPKNAYIIGHDEMKKYLDKTGNLKLNVNEIKDIDSILNAVREKVVYSGNIVLGNSKHVMESHRCINTHYALGCQDVYDGKYTAYTTSIRNPEYCFGACYGGDIQFSIKILDPYQVTRCMECFHLNVVSDSYYSASLEDCTNCIFSFNQRHKNYLIGNVQLTRDKYSELKNKIINEIAEKFEKNKSVPSVINIISGKGDWNG